MMATGDPVGPPSVVQQNALFAYKVEVQPVIYFHSTHGVAGKVFGFILIFPVLTLNLTDYGEKNFCCRYEITSAHWLFHPSNAVLTMSIVIAW